MRAGLFFFTVFAAWAGAAPAQVDPAARVDSLEADLRRCRAIADAVARIACYDSIGLAPPSTTTARRAASDAEPPRPASDASTPRTASSVDERSFGLPARSAPQASSQSIESTLVGDFDGWTPGAKLRLSNDQVWEIADGSTASHQAIRSPKVRISRGALGSYFMSVEGLSQTPRVRRLK